MNRRRFFGSLMALAVAPFVPRPALDWKTIPSVITFKGIPVVFDETVSKSRLLGIDTATFKFWRNSCEYMDTRG